MIIEDQPYNTSKLKHDEALENKKKLKEWHRFFAILPVPVNVNSEENTCDKVFLQWVERRAKVFEMDYQRGACIQSCRYREDHVRDWEYRLPLN